MFEICNLGQNICKLFHILAHIPFITSKAELYSYHQKVNVRVASRVAKRLILNKAGLFEDNFFWEGVNLTSLQPPFIFQEKLI